MDRSCTSAPDHPAAMRTAGSAAIDILLSATTGECGKPASASQARSVVLETPVLRKPQNGRRTASEPQAHSTSHAHPGHRSPLSKTEPKPSGSRPPGLSILVAWRGNPPAQPRLEHRYYLHSDAWRLSLLSGCHGLVQPFCTQLGTLQHLGNKLLPGRTQRRFPLRPTQNLELRSGLAVYL